MLGSKLPELLAVGCTINSPLFFLYGFLPVKPHSVEDGFTSQTSSSHVLST